MKCVLCLFVMVSACAGPAKPKQRTNEPFLASACPRDVVLQRIVLEQERRLDICENSDEKLSVARLCQVAVFLAQTEEYKNVGFSIEPGDPWTEQAVVQGDVLLKQLRAAGATSTGVLYSSGRITISTPQHLEIHCVQQVGNAAFVVRFDGIAVRSRVQK